LVAIFLIDQCRFADADGSRDLARRPGAIRITKNQKDVDVLDSVDARVKEGA